MLCVCVCDISLPLLWRSFQKWEHCKTSCICWRNNSIVYIIPHLFNKDNKRHPLNKIFQNPALSCYIARSKSRSQPTCRCSDSGQVDKSRDTLCHLPLCFVFILNKLCLSLLICRWDLGGHNMPSKMGIVLKACTPYGSTAPGNEKYGGTISGVILLR